MIGTKIRSIHHLFRIAEPKKLHNCLLTAGNRAFSGLVYVDGGKAYFFQNFFGCDIDFRRIPHKFTASEKEIIMRYGNVGYCRNMEEVQFSVILLPDDFVDQYNKFIDGNKKVLAGVVDMLARQESTAKYVFNCLNGSSANLFAWVLTNYFKNKVHSIDFLFNLIALYERYGKGKLTKGSITSYNGWKNLFLLEEELITARRMKRCNAVINSFNTAQKKILKNAILTDKEVNLISKFSALSYTKRNNFVRKMSTIECADEIFKHMSILVSASFDWNKESLLYYIDNVENLDCKVVYNAGDIVVVKANNFDTVKYLARATNWCIAKNKSYWNNYMKDDDYIEQYVMYDFSRPEDDEYAVVGFTTVGGSIKYAHGYTNVNLMKSTDFIRLCDSWLNASKNIFELLKDNDVPKSVYGDEEETFSFTEESFKEYLNSVVPEDDYYVLKDEDGQFVIETRNYNVLQALSEDVRNRGMVEVSSEDKLLVFADFSKGEEDDNMLAVCYIGEDSQEKMERCYYGICHNGKEFNNEYFNILLKEFGLPYNTISRVYTLENELANSFKAINIANLQRLLPKPEVRKLFWNQNFVRKHLPMNTIYDSLFGAHTLELINLLYANGYKLSEIYGTANLADILSGVFQHMYQIRGGSRRVVNVFDEGTLEKFTQHSLGNREADIVGYFVALKTIIDNEDDLDAFARFCQTIGLEYVDDAFGGIVTWLIQKFIARSKWGDFASDLELLLLSAVKCRRMTDAIAQIVNRTSSTMTLNAISAFPEKIIIKLPKATQEKLSTVYANND